MQAAEARLHELDGLAVPALRLPHRARLRALPELPAQAQGALRELLAPARPGLDDLPLLRGRRARAGRAAPAPAPLGRARGRAAATSQRAHRRPSPRRDANGRRAPSTSPHQHGDARSRPHRHRRRSPRWREELDADRRRPGRRRRGLHAPALLGRSPRPGGRPRRRRRSLTRNPRAKEAMDRTLILVKPDAFARALTGEIIARFERKGLKIVALRHMTVTRELAERHYAEHAERPFFGELVEFITSGPIVAMVLEGEDAVKAARQVIGATEPARGGDRLDPRRLRDRDRAEHGPRLGLAGVRRARDRAVLRRLTPRSRPERRATASSSPRARRSGGRSSSASGSTSPCGSPTWPSSSRASRPRSRSRTRCARRAPCARPGAASWCSAATRSSRSTGASTASPPTSAQAAATIRALAGRTQEVVSGLAVLRRRRGAHRGGQRPPGHVPRARRGAGRVVRGDGRVAGALGRLRDPGRGRGAGRARSRAKYENVVGLPLAALLDLCSGAAGADRRRAARPPLRAWRGRTSGTFAAQSGCASLAGARTGVR